MTRPRLYTIGLFDTIRGVIGCPVVLGPRAHFLLDKDYLGEGQSPVGASWLDETCALRMGGTDIFFISIPIQVFCAPRF